jgi:hypothetical protein
MISKLSSHLGPGSLFAGGLTPSLVLYLDAGNTYSYPGTGSNWYDLSSYNNDGVFLYSPTYSTDWDGYIEFDGLLTQNQVSFPGLTAIPIGDSHYTIETWVKSALDNGGIISWGNENLANSYNALRYNGDRLINYWWSNDLYTSPLGMTSSVFYHIVAKYDGTNREIWVNGTMSAQDTPGVHSPNTFSNLLVGVAYAGFGEYLYGGIGALKIFNKSLSSTQIMTSFNASKERFGYQYGSFVFDSGSNQYLSSSSSDYIIGTGDFTIEAFVKSLTQSGYDGIISLSPQSDQLGPRINASGGLFEFWTSNSGGPFGYTMSNNIWYHVAMTRNSGTVSCFINGELKNQFLDNSNFTHQDLVIGRYYTDTSAHYIDGIVTGIRFVNGISIYNSNFTIPDSSLTATSSTVLLLNTVKNNPLKDLSGLTHSVQGSYGWTSSLPYFYEFEYLDFSSTVGLDLVSFYQVSNNFIYLTNIVNSDVGNVYWSTSTNYNRSFSLQFNFECSGGNGADGFCVQWTTTNNTNGGVGGDVGAINSAHNSFQFRTWTNDNIEHKNNGTSVSVHSISPFNFGQNVYYWMDYNYNTSEMLIYYSTSNTKPGSAQHTLGGVTFDNGSYYIGFGASCGGSNDYHILKSMRLQFNS